MSFNTEEDLWQNTAPNPLDWPANNSNNSAMVSPPLTNPYHPHLPTTAPTVESSTQDKVTHPEWGVMKDQEFHPLTYKHQCDLENLYQTDSALSDFYFWQASLGGYCMADMVQNVVVSPEQAYVLVRQIVDGMPPPGRKKSSKKQNV